MNMNKLIAAGLIASVCAVSAESAPCRDGGFYVGVNAGIAITKNKIKSSKKITRKVGGEYNGSKVIADDEDTSKAHGEKQNVSYVNTEIGAAYDAMKNANKKRTKFMAELVLGYDWRINDVKLGIDLTIGNAFGKAKLKTKKEKEIEDGRDTAHNQLNTPRVFAKINTLWQIAVMPRVGYLITPETEVYATAGIKLSNYEVSTFRGADEDAQPKAALPQDRDPLPKQNYLRELTKKSIRLIPVVGAGIRYDITDNMFAKLEYNYELPTKVKAHKEALQDTCSKSFKIRTQAHIVKLGLGIRF